MKTKLLLHGVILLLFFFGLWGMFIWLFPEKWEYKPDLSIEKEEAIGDKMIELLLSDEKKIYEPKVTEAIRIIGSRLKNGIDNPGYTYHFHIIRKKDVNAFTFPGGHIVIFSGLIESCDNPEQLASVIAHEMGHAEHKHVVKRLGRQFGITVLAGMIFNDPGTVAQVLQMVIATSFDRDEEREADMFALKVMEKSHIHPKHFGDLFEKMSKEQGDFGDAMELIMTHPDNKERISRARSWKLKKGFTEKAFDEISFSDVKKMLGDDGI